MGNQISVAEALDSIVRHTMPLPARDTALAAESCGHVLAEAVVAAADTPRFDCSAMDGFALASDATLGATPAHQAKFALADDIPAEAAHGRLLPGMAAPISTGALIPSGADAVIAHERCRIAGDHVLVGEAISCGRNIRRRGEDLRAGAIVAEAGTALSPMLIGALLAAGVSRAEARPPPRLLILPTGSELVVPASTDRLARVDCNGPMIGAMGRSLGLAVKLASPVPDDTALLTRALASTAEAGGADMIVSTGGVSVGAHDHVRDALERAGAEIVFHGIAMRPGKPVLFAVLPDGRPFFGLPGNPVAALVGFRFFAFAALRRLLGLRPEQGRATDFAPGGRPGTTLFLRSRVDDAGKVTLADDQRSHVLRSVIECDHWVRIDSSPRGTTSTLFRQMPTLLA